MQEPAPARVQNATARAGCETPGEGGLGPGRMWFQPYFKREEGVQTHWRRPASG